MLVGRYCKVLGKYGVLPLDYFSEGRVCSYYKCLRQFGLEWFGRRSFFDQRGNSDQALWMDIALTRKSGQELHNDYIITDSPVFDYSSVQRSGNSFTPTSTFHDLASTLHLQLLPQRDAGYAELPRSTMIALQHIPQGGTLRMISRRQRHCWLRLGCPRLHQQVPLSPLWPIHSHR